MALTREQLLERRRFLGSSDIPAVAQLSRFKGPHHVWMQKVPTRETCPLCKGIGSYVALDGVTTRCDPCNGEGSIENDAIEDSETSEAAEIGDAVEEPIARIYERRSGRSIRKVRTSAIHPEHRWAAAMPDFESTDGGPDIEVKMVGAHMLDGWGEGEDEIPPDYYAQVTWQMACRGKRSTHVVANLGGTRLRVYDIAFNERLASELFEVGRSFWFDHVVSQVPPPLDGTKSARAFLERRYPEHVRGIEPAPFEALGIVTELRELKRVLKSGEARKDELETRLKGMIGDAEGIESDAWGVATWRRTASMGIDWFQVAQALVARVETVMRERVGEPELTAAAYAHATWHSLVEKHTRPGYRRLHVSDNATRKRKVRR